MAEVDDLMAEVGENSAKGGRCRGRHQSLLGHIFHFGFKVLIIYLAIRFCIALVKFSGKWIDKMLGLAPNR